MQRVRLFFLCSIALLLAGRPGVAPAGDGQAAPALAQMHHTAWGAAAGAPPNIFALAQGADGFLWIGSETGLFRFDGMRFERYAFAPGQRLPSLAVAALMIDRQQRLWIGARFGGVSVLAPDGQLRHHGQANGLPRGSVRCLLQDRDGVIWAGTTEGLAWFDGARWQALAALRGARIAHLALDRRGTLWVSDNLGISVVPAGTRQVRRLDLGAPGADASAAVAPDGAVWMASRKGLFQLQQTGAGVRVRRTGVPAGSGADTLFIDRRGGLWWGMWFGTGGLFYYARPGARDDAARRAPAPAEYFSVAQGLSSAQPSAQLEDTEGNIWVGTTGGLDRFRPNRLQQAAPALVAQTLWHVAPDGALWSGASNTALRRDGQAPRSFAALGRQPSAALDLPDGALLVATDTGLWQVQGSAATALPTPVPVQAGAEVQAMLLDRRGDLWLSQVRRGLFRRSAGHWRATAAPGLWPGAAVSLHLDAGGRVWLGYSDSRLAVVAADGAGETVRQFGPADGLDVGNVLAMAHDATRLWVGGDRGVAEFDGRHFRRLADQQGQDYAGASGIGVSADGALWINGAAGVSRIAAAELARARLAPQALLRHERFDHLDGLPGLPTQVRPIPTLASGPDGRFWFATDHGVVWLDPLHIARNTQPPPVQIRGLRSNERDYPAAGATILPAGTAELEIAYTALSLAIPERVRFRYRLDGVDRDWREVGGRRTAYYNNLGPGEYRFRVRASNNDDVWNDVGASMAFQIAPAYYQTAWFRLGCALLGGAALWLLHRLRLRVIGARHRARLDERERIAREWHDTLLQSTQGLIVHFQAVAERLPAHQVDHARLQRVLDQADGVLAEGRDRVLQLRQDGAGDDLAAALAQLAGGLGERHAVHWRVRVAGVPQALRRDAAAELLSVAGEAMLNAFRHAGATRIDVWLAYAAVQVTLSVRDDGLGLPAAVLRDGGRAGHWGLPGMRERAAKLGAQLHIDSGDHGTVIVLRLAAALAYRQRWRAWWRAVLRRRAYMNLM